MATRLKPTRINVDNTPRVGDGAAYQNDNDFHWSMGGGDMAYEDFEWVTLTGNSLVIENISNNVTPTGNFTVTAGTLRPGIEYVLRVNTGNTPYTMTLGTGVTNPNGYNTELELNTVNQFKFIATSANQLELEGVDSAVISEINWGGIGGTLSDQTDLQNALDEKQDTLTAGTGINITSNTISTNWIEVNVATANGTAAKVGTTTAGDYTPTKGDFLLVNFVNGCNVDNPTLNIDGSGAKNIRTGSANATKSTFALGTTANSNIKALLYYDGTYYRCWSTSDTNTTYSAMSVSEGQTGTATSSRAMTAANLKSIIKYHAVDNSRLSDDWYSDIAIAPSQASIYYEFAKRDIQAGTDLEIVGISSHNLPAGYTELSFLGGSGSGYINTGNILQCKDTFKIKFKRPTATAPSGTLSFFGSLQGSNSIPRSNVGFRANGYLFGGVNQTIDFASIDTNIHTIEIGYDGVSYYYKYDNGAKKTYTLTSATNPSINAYLFARNSSPIVYSGGIRIYYLEWHREDGTEVAHLIPAQRDSDGVLGMYDLVSDTFLAPAGSGTWSGEPLGNVINFTNDSGFLTSSTGVASVNGNHGAVTVNEPIISATAPASPTEGMVWYDTTNDQLKVYDGTNWKATGSEYHAGEGISIGSVVINGRQGPAPEGFHVPSVDEWAGLKDIMDNGGLSSGNDLKTNLYMPFSGYRYDDGEIDAQGTEGRYWSSSPFSGGTGLQDEMSYYLSIATTGYAEPIEFNIRSYGYSIRCFKDVPVEIEDPTNPGGDWDLINNVGIGFYIFHSPSLGVITIMYRHNGREYITIADKNLGATTVYNDGDTLSEANCGKYYQWGNNYGFPWTGAITTSSTQVDATGYGPGNYYSSDTFITGSADWSSVRNPDLWGDTTGTITQDNVIKNTGVLSVNGQTGDVTIQNENNVKVFETANNVVIQGGDFTNDATLVAQIQEMVEWLTEDSNHAACIVYKENSGGSVHAVTLYVYEADNATMGASDKLLEFYYMSQDGDAIYYQYGHIDIISGAVSSASISNRNVVANKFSPLNSGTTGQVLTKTSSGYNWQDASGGFELAPNSPLTPKYRRYGTQAQYEALTQYYTDEPGDTVYFTI